MGKSTIFMAIFNSYVSLPEGTANYSWVLGLSENSVHHSHDEKLLQNWGVNPPFSDTATDRIVVGDISHDIQFNIPLHHQNIPKPSFDHGTYIIYLQFKMVVPSGNLTWLLNMAI